MVNLNLDARNERVRRVMELLDLQAIRELTQEEQAELYNRSSTEQRTRLEQEQPDAFVVLDNAEPSSGSNHNSNGEHSRTNRNDHSCRQPRTRNNRNDVGSYNNRDHDFGWNDDTYSVRTHQLSIYDTQLNNRHWTDHQNAKNTPLARREGQHLTEMRNNEFQRSGRSPRQLPAHENEAAHQSNQSSTFNSSGGQSTNRPITKITLLGDTVAIQRAQMQESWDEVHKNRPAGVQCEGVIVGLGPKHYDESAETQTLRLGDRVLIPEKGGVPHSLPTYPHIFELFHYKDILALLN
ncbi:hypothetical protein M3Y94_00462900 [Aphelenchoides besseyi]|nr:hypothetical protein M3Y94_00462900 [Aphelenchoides besseyi]KAI6229198.1 hypothetical protein M3Y95_00506000 [Aphelenchoides besseyi]